MKTSAFLRKELDENPTSERCEICNGFIVGWDWPNSILGEDGRVTCKNCMKTTTCEHIITDGPETKQVRPDNGTDFTLEEIQAAVGGNIEVVPLRETGLILICNEDGHALGLPLNQLAMKRLASLLLCDVADILPIVGNVVICESEMLQ